MKNVELYSKIEMLPDDLKEELGVFVDELLSKLDGSNKLNERQFGAFRGRITMASDIDAPLEDFKDYM